jgi:hypothetical protein
MTTTKSKLAAELGVSAARVSQLCKRGMPTLEGGILDREAALRWISRYMSSHGGGWSNRGRNISRTATALLANEFPLTRSGQTAEDLIRAITEQSLEVFAKVCIKCGLSPRDTFFATNLHMLAALIPFHGEDHGCPGPEDEQWRAQLGDVDVDALYNEFDIVMAPDLDPLNSDEST